MIVGCGFTGAAVAAGLDGAARRHKVEVTVVDPDGVLVHTPALGSLAAGRVAFGPALCTPLQILAPRARHLPGRAVQVDAAAKTVAVVPEVGSGTREIRYDHLVVGVGGVWEDRHVPGAVENALAFRGIGDALELRRRVLTGLATAASCTDAAERRRSATVAVVGGGLAGVAAAAAAADLQAAAVRAWDPSLAGDARVVVSELKARLVAGMPHDLCNAVESTLAHNGVEVVTSDAVTRVDPTAVTRKSGVALEAATVVWAAGNRAAPAAQALLGAAAAGAGRLSVTPQLQVSGAADVWAGGDAVAVPHVLAGGDCPATAEFATAAGRRIARNILRVLDGNFPMALRHQPMAEAVPLAAATITRARGRIMSGIPAAVLSNPPHVVARRINRGVRSLVRPTVPPAVDMGLSEVLGAKAASTTAVTLTRRSTGT